MAVVSVSGVSRTLERVTDELLHEVDEQPRNKSLAKRVAVMTLSAALVLVVGGVAIAALFLNSVRGAYEDSVNVIPESDGVEGHEQPDAVTRTETGEDGEDIEVPDDQLNILLIGSDAGGGSGEDENVPWLPNAGRADAMMLVHIPHDRESVYMMSIMRDTWVPIPGHGEAKINAALSFGEGAEYAQAAVENMFGVPIDHVAAVDMQGFQGLVAEMGGVTVDSPVAFTSRDGYQFQAGPQHMNESQALSFVRERRAFSDGDYQRVQNQQAFMRGVIEDVATPQTLSNPARVHSMVSGFSPHMSVDSRLADGGYVADLGWELRNIRGGDIETFTLPNLGTGRAGSESIVVADWDAIEEAGEAMREGSFDEFAAQQ